jgi:hypothetical protein
LCTIVACSHDVALKLSPEALVGRLVRVLWPDEEAWFMGTITDYSPADGKHKVCLGMMRCMLG